MGVVGGENDVVFEGEFGSVFDDLVIATFSGLMNSRLN